MLFNSISFLIFFPTVLVGYLLLGRWHRAQNLWLLAASLFFYGYWDWRFLGLLIFTVVANYFGAHAVARAKDTPRKKLLVGVTTALNLGVLGFFKYFNFFTDSAVWVMHSLGMRADAFTIKVILPVGISFYTFQAISYVVDVYRGHIPPTRNVLDLALFISLFPQLVAGPIERAERLLPQVLEKRTITWPQVHAGIFLIVAGYYKKVVIADNMALIADKVFDNYTTFSGLDLLIGCLAFTFQIYGDFSGYSDIARGIGKLLGFDLMVNFRLPYFAISPSDFWQRWHISLSSWLRDYLYIPLGGNRDAPWKTYRNLALTMLLGGLWHGASWNFVIWGAFHGAILIIYRRFDRTREKDPSLATWHRRSLVGAKMALMFALTVIGWIIFRSRTAEQVWGVLTGIGIETSKHTEGYAWKLAFFVLPLIAVQVWQQTTRDLLAPLRLKPWVLAPVYAIMIAAVISLGVRESIEFIYFQF